jgi:hypothetical protein
VIPFSGAAMAQDQGLLPYTTFERRWIEFSDLSWEQPTRILPADAEVRAVILEIEERVQEQLADTRTTRRHLPSRDRSLLWISNAVSVLQASRVSPLPNLKLSLNHRDAHPSAFAVSDAARNE